MSATSLPGKATSHGNKTSTIPGTLGYEKKIYMATHALYLILGDQLNRQHTWFKEKSTQKTFLFIESREEASYAAHHIQKIVAFFAGMRAFAEELREAGHQVRYLKLHDEANQGDIPSTVAHLIAMEGYTSFHYQLPDEYRLDEALKSLEDRLSVPVTVSDSEHFLTSRTDFQTIFKGKKMYLLESFYRKMRQKYDILMVNAEPEGGKWNYDHSNRNPWKSDFKPATPLLFHTDVKEIMEDLKQAGITGIGRIEPANFIWPINRKQSLQLLDYFLENHLPEFGKFQDVMDSRNGFLNHSRLSFAINSKMLHPLEVCEKAVAFWRSNDDRIDIAQVEGFIRQILGWREYMRGVYWAHMPEYASMNYFEHDRPLPKWYWTGDTKMNCLKYSIEDSLNNAYAHHIQRLMVTGNFALLAGIAPEEVDAWYLGIYIDAIEWVEITNTRGMSQFADGGLVGTKPYVSSANYIDKMSNYCTGCHYSKSKRTGEKACPFNSLYWHFYQRHRDKLEKNARIGFVYQTLDKMAADKKTALLEQAETYLKDIEQL